jgi:NADH-quinone oxidoreductase subunit N
MNPSYRELLHALLPEVALVVGALVALTLDLVTGRGRTVAQRVNVAALVGAVAVIAAIYGACQAGVAGPAFGHVLMLDTLTLATRVGVLGLALLALGVVAGTSQLRNPAEFVALLLFATSGFTLMAAAQQLLLAFLALELASLSLYILVGFAKTRPQSAEAAVKYFLFGGMSAAFLLFGFSLIYGLTGAIEFNEIAARLSVQTDLTPLHVVALVMVLAGFGFKAAAAPFHLWAPDAYQGAPAPAAALVASASKLAGIVLFTRLLWTGLGSAAGSTVGPIGSGWLNVISVIAAVSLLIGNFAALAQTNVRRLLAYSAIAHAGALLLGLMSAATGVGPLFYYAATYGLATVGAFGVIAVVERNGRCQQITDLAGLSRRSPLLAACLVVFILSLAGIPPLAGFFGKFAVFAAALQVAGIGGTAGLLALAAILLSAVALYYYLVVLKQALVVGPTTTTRIATPVSTGFALVAAALLLIVFGLWPSALLGLFAG